MKITGTERSMRKIPLYRCFNWGGAFDQLGRPVWMSSLTKGESLPGLVKVGFVIIEDEEKELWLLFIWVLVVVEEGKVELVVELVVWVLVVVLDLAEAGAVDFSYFGTL